MGFFVFFSFARHSVRHCVIVILKIRLIDEGFLCIRLFFSKAIRRNYIGAV